MNRSEILTSHLDDGMGATEDERWNGWMIIVLLFDADLWMLIVIEAGWEKKRGGGRARAEFGGSYTESRVLLK